MLFVLLHADPGLLRAPSAGAGAGAGAARDGGPRAAAQVARVVAACLSDLEVSAHGRSQGGPVFPRRAHSS